MRRIKVEIAGVVPLQVSEIQLFPISPRDGLVGFCSFVVDGRLFIGDVAVHAKPGGGYRLTYPVKRLANSILPIVRPVTKEAGEAIQNAVAAEFEALVKLSLRNVGDREEVN